MRHFPDIDLNIEMGYLDDQNDQVANEHIFVRGRSDEEVAADAMQALVRLPALPLRVEGVDGHAAIVDADGLRFIRGEVYGDGCSGISGDELALDALVDVVNSLSHLAPVLEDDDLNDNLRRLPGRPWALWTSCSFRRISKARGGDGDVLTGDRHGDLSLSEKSLGALCNIVSAASPLLEKIASANPELNSADIA